MPAKLSKKLFIKYSLPALFLLSFVGLVSALYFPVSPSRQIASVENRKRLTQPLSKHLAVVSVAIDPTSIVPENNSDSTEVRAYVKLNVDLPGANIHYKWKLDSGIQILSGQESGALNGVPVGTAQVLTLNIAGFSKQDSKMIHLEVSVDYGNDQLGNTAMLHSRPEDSFEYLAEDRMLVADQLSAKIAAESSASSDEVSEEPKPDTVIQSKIYR